MLRRLDAWAVLGACVLAAAVIGAAAYWADQDSRSRKASYRCPPQHVVLFNSGNVLCVPGEPAVSD